MARRAERFGARLREPHPTMRRAAALCALLLSCALAAPRAEAATALVSFGDSLSDRGNARIATGGAVPLPAFYADGRFSNGPIWVERFSAAAGLPAPVPSLAGGTNFAVGSARTGVTALTPTPRPEDLPGQVSAYLAGPQAPAGALFSVWIGSNDLVFSLLGGVPLAAVIPVAVGNTLAEITRLATLGGARDLLVLGVPDLGLVPLFAGNPLAAAAASAATQAFNGLLRSGLEALVLPAGTGTRFLDVSPLLAGAIADPPGFGFTNATQPCFTGNSFTPGAVCSTDPSVQDGFVFWDALHPTSAGHALIAGAVLAAVPAPGALALLLAGLGLLRQGRG